MSEPTLLSRESLATNARVRCAIGHMGRADVFTARYRYTDMDGEPLVPFDVKQYEPATCVTCGLPIYQRVAPHA